MVRYWWRQLNHAIFEGQLREPVQFIIRPMQDWAEIETQSMYSKSTPIKIHLSDDIHERGLLLAVLAHEMVHQWEQQKFARLTHGKNFWSWQHKIESLGLDFDKSF